MLVQLWFFFWSFEASATNCKNYVLLVLSMFLLESCFLIFVSKAQCKSHKTLKMCDTLTFNSFADICFTSFDCKNPFQDLLDCILHFFVAQVFFIDLVIFASKAIQVHSGNQNQIEIHLTGKLVFIFWRGKSDEFSISAEEKVMIF